MRLAVRATRRLSGYIVAKRQRSETAVLLFRRPAMGDPEAPAAAVPDYFQQPGRQSAAAQPAQTAE